LIDDVESKERTVACTSVQEREEEEEEERLCADVVLYSLGKEEQTCCWLRVGDTAR
jgi:hypothetical protein